MVYVVALVLLAVSFAATFATADPVNPQSLTTAGTGTRDISTIPTQSLGAQGGNVTGLNIHALTVTQSWQGYYGNVTGTVTLQDSRNYTFYNWSAAQPSGEIYATRNSSVSFADINCSGLANLTNEETFLGQSASDPDSVRNTFNRLVHPSFTVGSMTIPANNCNSTNGYVNNNSQTGNFVMVLLNNKHNMIYTTIINNSVTGYDGAPHDFELLVGENEKTGNIGATAYYFFVELS